MDGSFTGVPDREWHEIGRDARRGALLGWLAFCIAVLLVLTLIEKGVLAGWSDLFRLASPAGG